MKKSFLLINLLLLSLAANNVVTVQAQEKKSVMRLQGGYAFANGHKDAALDDGANIKLSWDERIPESKSWFAGLGAQYLRSSFLDLPTAGDAPSDLYAFVVRAGWQTQLFCDDLALWFALEGGSGLMQSRHQYDGMRYRLKRGTAVGGFEIGLDYRLTDTFGLSLAWSATRFGNDNLQHGSVAASLPKPSIFSTSALNAGLSITLK